MEGIKATVVSLLVVGLLVLFSSVYTISEGHQSIVLRFGKVVTEAGSKKPIFNGPGLHTKIPVVDNVQFFDMRLHTFEPKPSRIVTAEQKDVIVDYFVKWRLSDPALFYTRTSNHIYQAEKLLEQQLSDKLRAEFGKRNIGQVISDDRLEIMLALQKQANVSAAYLGLHIVDVRIKRIELPTSVSEAVFERMRSERLKVATKHREQGKAEAENIRTKAQAAAMVRVATAADQAAETRAKGDREAAAVYALAYDRDPEFYEFYRSMLAYKDVFVTKKDILVLKPKGQFFKYFAAATGQAQKHA